MKSKLLGVLKGLLILWLGVLAAMALFQFADVLGFFGRWVEDRYLIFSGYPGDGGSYYFETSINWDGVKRDIFILLIANTVIWLGAVLAAVAWAKHREQKKLSAEMAEMKMDMGRKEQELKSETARKNDLIAYLAHDLKTPLTSVIGYLSLLDEAPDMPPEQRAKYTRITLDKAYRLEKMINEFFDITRYNLQQIVVQKEPIDLYYMLVQLTDELLPVLDANGNTVVLKADENLSISGDPDKLARVFNNVLKNAAAYSYPNTEILISAEETAGSVTIRFTNRGKTIPKNKLGSIFEKFYRMDEARTSGTGGAGLGLAIAREIVTLHGGTISADSENDTVAFTVTLPAGNEISTQP